MTGAQKAGSAIAATNLIFTAWVNSDADETENEPEQPNKEWTKE